MTKNDTRYVDSALKVEELCMVIHTTLSHKYWNGTLQNFGTLCLFLVILSASRYFNYDAQVYWTGLPGVCHRFVDQRLMWNHELTAPNNHSILMAFICSPFLLISFVVGEEKMIRTNQRAITKEHIFCIAIAIQTYYTMFDPQSTNCSFHRMSLHNNVPTPILTQKISYHVLQQNSCSNPNGILTENSKKHGDRTVILLLIHRFPRRIFRLFAWVFDI